QQAALAHLVEAVKGGLPGAVAPGQVPPRGAGMQAPEDAVKEGAVVPPLAAPLAGPGREEGGQPPPLLIGKFVPLHTRLDAPRPSFDSSDRDFKLVPCVPSTDARWLLPDSLSTAAFSSPEFGREAG